MIKSISVIIIIGFITIITYTWLTDEEMISRGEKVLVSHQLKDDTKQEILVENSEILTLAQKEYVETNIKDIESNKIQEVLKIEKINTEKKEERAIDEKLDFESIRENPDLSDDEKEQQIDELLYEEEDVVENLAYMEIEHKEEEKFLAMLKEEEEGREEEMENR